MIEVEGGSYIFGLALTLEIWFDRFVLLVELRQVRYQVLDYVGVREWIDPGFVAGVGWDATWIESVIGGHPSKGNYGTYIGRRVC